MEVRILKVAALVDRTKLQRVTVALVCCDMQISTDTPSMCIRRCAMHILSRLFYPDQL